VGLDKRIGHQFLHPGPGFGGSCFPKDIRSLVSIAGDAGYDFEIGQAILNVNERQKEQVVTRSRQLLGDLSGKTVCLLGLAFKPGTDDIREAPAIHVARRLQAEGAAVQAYDPVAMNEAKKELPDLKYCDNYLQAASGADLIIIATEWHEFRDLDFNKIKATLRSPNIYDTRNIYDPARMKQLGFTYICTGRN
jgi:UDPglucose 6-dehydrogenase